MKGYDIKRFALNTLIKDLDAIVGEENDLLTDNNPQPKRVYSIDFMIIDLNNVKAKLLAITDNLTDEYNLFMKQIILDRIELIERELAQLSIRYPVK